MVSIVENAAKREKERPFMSLDKAALVPSRFELDLCYDDVRIKKLDDIDVFKAFVFAFDEESALRDELCNAVNEIYSQCTPEMRAALEEHRQIRVEFTMSAARRRQDLSVAYLNKAMELVKGIGERSHEAKATSRADDSKHNLQQYRFPYTGTSASLVINSCKLEQGGTSLLKELLALGVQINDEISIGSYSALGRLPISKLDPVLHVMTDRCSFRALERYEQILRSGWDRLWLEQWTPDGPWHARLLEAVCSSLAASRDFRQLPLAQCGSRSSSQDKSRQKILQWLAYALFSKDSTIRRRYDGNGRCVWGKNPAKELLDGDSFQGHDGIDSSDSETGDLSGQQVAGDGNPASTTQGSVDTEDDLGFAFLKAGTTITIKPIDDENQLVSNSESIVLKQDGLFRVMQNEESLESVDIVVPHYGYCVVFCGALDHFEPAASSESPLSAGYGGSITSLEVRGSDHEALVPLIEFVGPKLVSFFIIDNIASTNILRRVLAACPNLTKVKLDMVENTAMTAFTEAYGSGRCKIESLCIHTVVRDHSESIVAFVRMIQDPECAAAKSLRRLALVPEPFIPPDNCLDESVFTAIAEMLQVNRTIEYLDIELSEALAEEHEDPLMKTDCLCVVRGPLSMASRCAFLSVLHQYSSSSTSSEEPQKKTPPLCPYY